MEELHFADILMILIVSGVIYGILALVRRSARKNQKNVGGITTCETDSEIGKSAEDN
jgi:hypothetical protein